MKNHLILGSWNVICDVCGQEYKAKDVKKRWDGLIVCSKDWEPRHPQDFLRVQQEKISVPFARPEGEDVFIQSCSLPGRTAIPGLSIPSCMIPAYNPPGFEGYYDSDGA